MGSARSNDAMVRDFLAAWERRDTEYIVDHFVPRLTQFRGSPEVAVAPLR